METMCIIANGSDLVQRVTKALLSGGLICHFTMASPPTRDLGAAG